MERCALLHRVEATPDKSAVYHESVVFHYILCMPVTDTSPSVARILVEANRALTPTQRLERVVALNQALDEIVEASIRSKHPDLADQEISDLVARRRLGEELFRKAVDARDRAKAVNAAK